MKNTISKTSVPGPAATALIGLKAPKKAQVLIVDDETSNIEILSRFLTKEGYCVTTASNGVEALEKINTTHPDLLLLDVVMPVMDGLTLCRQLRSELTTRSLPILLLTAHNTLPDRLYGLQAGVDDYIGKPFDLQEVKIRLESALQRRRIDLASNPLTHLPGSPAIEEEIWKRLRIGFPFTFAYIDIDHFKAYNDVYGYEAGDKVIKSLGTLLIEDVKLAPGGCAFAGHVGGDDFVYVSTLEHMKSTLPQITQHFDALRKDMYHPEDLERGGLHTKDRQGQERNFPFMTLSVAIVSTSTRRILHYARLVEIASELKKYVKEQPHDNRSLIIWDRRTDSLKEQLHD